MDRKQIGENIRELRCRKGMTQEGLAEKADLSVPYISHIERGRKNARLETLSRVAAALEVSLEEMFSGASEAEREQSRTAFDSLTADCTFEEQQMMLEMAAATKQVLRKRNRRG